MNAQHLLPQAPSRTIIPSPAAMFTSAALFAAVTSAGAPSPLEPAAPTPHLAAEATTPLPPITPSALPIEQRRPLPVELILNADHSVGHVELQKARVARAVRAPRHVQPG